MAEKWWKIQEPGDRVPSAVVYLGEDMLVRRYVPGEGLVDWPPMAMWVFGDEQGASEISQAEAVKLIKAGVGKLGKGVALPGSSRAPTIPVPGLS